MQSSMTASDAGSQRVGPLRLRANADEVAAFCRITGWSTAASNFLPATMPIKWLTAAPVRAALLEMAGASATVPVHESQSFAYDKRLLVAHDYDMTVTLTRLHVPERVKLDAVICDAGATQALANIETILRLVSLAEGDAA